MQGRGRARLGTGLLIETGYPNRGKVLNCSTIETSNCYGIPILHIRLVIKKRLSISQRKYFMMLDLCLKHCFKSKKSHYLALDAG